MYEIKEEKHKNNKNTDIWFIHVEINNIKKAIEKTFKIISDVSWINSITDPLLTATFEATSKSTIDYLSDTFNNAETINGDVGEYIISITSKDVLVKKFGYKDIPIGELIKDRKVGNGCFDYYSENTKENYPILGEAKYKKDSSGLTNALNQIIDFIADGKDTFDTNYIKNFLEKDTVDKVRINLKNKGFSAGFSFNGCAEKVINNLDLDDKYKKFLEYPELIMIGVTIINE